jgi:acetyltransferase-like isoleucine patch superfamily enzyme
MRPVRGFVTEDPMEQDVDHLDQLYRQMAAAKKQDGVPREDPVRLFKRFLSDLNTKWLMTTYPFANKVDKLSVHYSCQLSRRAAQRIHLGRYVQLHSDVWINVEAPLNVKDNPALILEDGVVIGRRSMISVKNGVHLERDVITGPGVLIMDHNHAYEDVTRSIKMQGVTEGGTIRIGQGSWLGFNASIVCSQGELVIGEHCLIAANSVITRSFPSFSVISGNPARVVRQFDPVKGIWTLGSVRTAESEIAR